jgi:putative membrane protein
MGWYYDGPGHWMYYGPLFIVIFMGACMVMMYLMMRAHIGGGRGDSSTQILKDRFARGEIDKAEYDDRKRTLGA